MSLMNLGDLCLLTDVIAASVSSATLIYRFSPFLLKHIVKTRSWYRRVLFTSLQLER